MECSFYHFYLTFSLFFYKSHSFIDLFIIVY
ncbi:putative membrane protein, partial [Clostridioides difficile CD196]